MLKLTISFSLLILGSLFLSSQSIKEVAWKASISELKTLNSNYRETNPTLSPDNQELYFFSRRGTMPWNVTRKDTVKYRGYDGDIWKSNFINSSWSKPINLKSINNSKGQDEPFILGNYLYYQDWSFGWQKNGGPYYKLHLNTKKREGLGNGITSFFIKTGFRATDGSTYSPDGKTMIFASAKSYNDDMDFYISYNKNNTWSYPKKLWISTSKDDRSCFLTFDESYLFFASNGYHDREDLDIYYVNLKDTTTIYHPTGNLNSSKDDLGLIFPATSTTGIFTRQGNLHEFKLHSEDAFFLNNELKRDTFIVNFDFGHRYLTKKGAEEFLNRLPDSERIKYIRVLGHTDQVGDYKKNLILAGNRTKSILTYLSSVDIPENKIRTSVYGESLPIINSDKEEAENRRCEVIVLWEE